MKDELVSSLLKEAGLRAVAVSTAALCRGARDAHGAEAASAVLLAEGLTGALLLASLQKEKTRVNVQLECTGPVKGVLADAGSDGTVRGYAKNPHCALIGSPGPFRWRPLFGNSGYLSVLREMGGGELYRSAVQLEAFDFTLDLERYFLVSEQVKSRVFIGIRPAGDEPLGTVIGVLLQTLPDGDGARLEELGKQLERGGFDAALDNPGGSIASFLTQLVGREGDLPEVMSRYPVAYQCSCTRERVYRALAAMGQAELEDVLRTDKKAEATCEFCTRVYVVTEEEIKSLLAQMSAQN